MRDRSSRFTFLVAALATVAGLQACRSSEQTGVDLEPPPAATGGAQSTRGGAGGVKATGGSSGGAQAGNPDATADVPASSDATADGASSDAPAGSSDATASDATTGTGSDATTGTGSDSGPAAGRAKRCAKDVLGLTTCRQLEIACENCPPGGAPAKNPTAKLCFELTDKAWLGQATDAECVAFAAAHKCTVDPGGNVCVNVDCDGSPGCENSNRTDKKGCFYNAHYGEQTPCRTFLPKCACKDD